MGLICFSAPNNIAPGGVGGIAVMVNYLSGFNISLMTMCINIPLLIMGWIFLGRAFTLKTLKSVAVLTIMYEIVDYFSLYYTGNELLAALYGGVLSGLGLAFVFMRSSTTGGTDVASRLIQLKFPAVSVGRLLLLVDGVVLIASAFVFKNIENALLGIISIFSCTMLLDSLLYGIDKGKLMMIMTLRPDEISLAVTEQLNRSCTFLEGRGSFSRREQPVILCVVRKSQYFDLKRLVHKTDPLAFMISLDASEIIGEGFKDIEASTKVQ